MEPRHAQCNCVIYIVQQCILLDYCQYCIQMIISCVTLHNITCSARCVSFYYNVLTGIPFQIHGQVYQVSLQHYTTLHCVTLHYTMLHYITLLHCITLCYTALHYATLHYTMLHCITLCYTAVHVHHATVRVYMYTNSLLTCTCLPRSEVSCFSLLFSLSCVLVSLTASSDSSRSVSHSSNVEFNFCVNSSQFCSAWS